jgi:hypothetical protein
MIATRHKRLLPELRVIVVPKLFGDTLVGMKYRRDEMSSHSRCQPRSVLQETQPSDVDITPALLLAGQNTEWNKADLVPIRHEEPAFPPPRALPANCELGGP